MDPRRRPDFRVIAEGDDAVGCDLTLLEALSIADVARTKGKRRYVAVVDDSTGAIVDERRARDWLEREGERPVPLVPPRAQAVAESTGAAAMAPRAIASGTRPRVPRVLVVDDDEVLGGVLRLSLSRELEVKVASEAGEALDSMLAGTWYDVVVCRLALKGMPGDSLRERVHAAWPELAERFVFVDDRRVDTRALCEVIRQLAIQGAGRAASGSR